MVSALDLVEAQPKFRRIDIEVEIPELPLVLLDSGRMQQVLVNLLLNAADAMNGEGEIAITARSEEGGEEPLVLLDVRDDGEGIAAEDAPHIFDPFFTTKDPGEGTGLGLAICQSIVESFGGRIEVASEPGEGAVFTIALRIAAPEADE